MKKQVHSWIILVCALVWNSISFGQKDNVHYTNLRQLDERITVTLHHNRTLGFGSQFFGVSIQNNTNCKLRVELEYSATLTCGQVVSRKIGFGSGIIINAGEKTKAEGFWDTDNTSFDAGNSRNSECLNSGKKSKKIEEGYTAIENVSFQILKITNLCENGQVISEVNASTNSGNNPNNSDNPNSGKEVCPDQSYSLAYSAGSTCVGLRWLSTATNSINADGTLVQNGNYSENFQLEYKKANELNWTSIRINGYQMEYLIKNLSPCTAYESRLRRVCSDNESSPWKNLNFTTSCPSPTGVTVRNITQNSVSLTTNKNSYSRCEINVPAPMRIIELKSTGSNEWKTYHWEPETPCPLTDLSSKTTYLVRVKYKYGNLESTYSKPIQFTTL